MKATLEFNLPEDQDEFKLASDGGKWHLVAWDMDQYLRGVLKYGNEYKDADEALEKARDRLHELMDGHSVSLYDVQ